MQLGKVKKKGILQKTAATETSDSNDLEEVTEAVQLEELFMPKLRDLHGLPVRLGTMQQLGIIKSYEDQQFLPGQIHWVPWCNLGYLNQRAQQR